MVPMGVKSVKRAHGRGAILGQVDGLGVVLDGRKIAAAHVFEKIAHLVHPAALMGHAG